VNPALISGLDGPSWLAVSKGSLFVVSHGTEPKSGTVGEYTTAGALVNAALVSDLDFPGAIDLAGENLFVTSYFDGMIGKYTISGETVNPVLVSGLDGPTSIAVISASVSESTSTWPLLSLALTATFGLKCCLHRRNSVSGGGPAGLQIGKKQGYCSS
jgi:hypothetical protein